MGLPAIRAFGRPAWARVALPHLAPLDRALVVGREVFACTEGALGGRGQAVGSNVLPPTAPTAESIRSPCLPKGIDLVPVSEESDSALTEAAEGRLAENCGHHRGGTVLVCLEMSTNLCPAQPPDLSRDMHPCSPPQAPPGAFGIHRPSPPPCPGTAICCGCGPTSTSAGESDL